MIHTAYAVRTLQAVAMTVGLALFLWGTGLPAIFQEVEAASITNASDTLSNSAPGDPSNHTIVFTTPSGISPSQKFRVEFESEFDLTSVTESDIDILVAGNSSSTQAGQSGGAATWGVDIVGDNIDFTAPNNQTVASSTEISILIGTNAAGPGVNQILNPNATGSYAINIGSGTSTIQDSGEVRVAIMDEVTVSASVNSTLEFSVTGVGSGQTVNGTSTTDASTVTTIPFGSLSGNQIKTLAQDLTVTTNAANGFSLTAVTSGDLLSTTGATIDGFIDGTNTTTPTTWVAPSATPADPDTYGHWGLTSSDSSLFGSNLWVSPSSTPVTVFDAGGPLNASTTRVGYQIEISDLQEAGDDYSTTIRYIATPTF